MISTIHLFIFVVIIIHINLIGCLAIWVIPFPISMLYIMDSPPFSFVKIAIVIIFYVWGFRSLSFGGVNIILYPPSSYIVVSAMCVSCIRAMSIFWILNLCIAHDYLSCVRKSPMFAEATFRHLSPCPIRILVLSVFHTLLIIFGIFCDLFLRVVFVIACQVFILF